MHDTSTAMGVRKQAARALKITPHASETVSSFPQDVQRCVVSVPVGTKLVVWATTAVAGEAAPQRQRRSGSASVKRTSGGEASGTTGLRRWCHHGLPKCTTPRADSAARTPPPISRPMANAGLDSNSARPDTIRNSPISRNCPKMNVPPRTRTSGAGCRLNAAPQL